MTVNFVKLNIILLISLIFFFVIPNIANAQIVDRLENFDKREACINAGGVWRQFGNGCADNCLAKFNKFNFCTMAVTYGCDCGKDSCYYNDKCYDLDKFEKVYEQIELENKKKSDAEKSERQMQYMIKKNEIIEGLIKRYNIPIENRTRSQYRTVSVSGPGRVVNLIPNNNVANFYSAREVSDENGRNQIVYYNRISNNGYFSQSSEQALPGGQYPIKQVDNSYNSGSDSRGNDSSNSRKKIVNNNQRKTANSDISSIIPPMFLNKILEDKLKKSEGTSQLDDQNFNSQDQNTNNDQNLKKLPIIPINGN